MGSLTRDIGRLAEDIRRGREQRQQGARHLRADEAARKQSAFEAAQQRTVVVERRRNEVRSSLESSRAKLETETSQLRDNLRSFADGLKSEVSAFRTEVQQDLQGARAAWHGSTGATVVRDGASKSAKSAKSATDASDAAGDKNTAADDLTSISGIGPGIQERLNNAGILSFVQLATKPVDEIRDVLGELNRLAHVEDWVLEAKSRVSGSKT